MLHDMPATIRVLLFARYAELFGADHLDLAGRPGMTVSDVVSPIRQLPGGDGLPSRPLCALNLRQAEGTEPVAAGDEVALLPPLAGG